MCSLKKGRVFNFLRGVCGANHLGISSLGIALQVVCFVVIVSFWKKLRYLSEFTNLSSVFSP